MDLQNNMFCYQCEQTFHGVGCNKIGVCGKTANVAVLQDLLIYTLQGLSWVAVAARAENISTRLADSFICQGLFTTITNVDFSEDSVIAVIEKAVELRSDLMRQFNTKALTLPAAVNFKVSHIKTELITLGHLHNVRDDKEKNPDIQSLKSTLLFGIKGVAAYANHAEILGQTDVKVFHFLQKSLSSMLRYDLSFNDWLNLVIECGTVNLSVMELLDKAHTQAYGNPIPTLVVIGAKKGKAILISGHDLKDLELLLKQTADQNIYVYTHGEMLPAHGYPQLKKYKHFYGHYGTAWQNQHEEFANFPGAILMTTNCIQKPLDTYKGRIFTTGLVAWPGIAHIGAEKNFSPVIEKALSEPGFVCDIESGNNVTVGFAHNAVLNVADSIIELVKNNKIRHFFLVAGCDGAKPGRNYYTEFVEKVPNDCIVLTLACGKFRFFTKKLGAINGVPRLIDIGQCNDAYSAIQIVIMLAKAFNCSVNDLPLSLILSWYEQKAVAILLTLLSLDIKNIRLGPSLPAFITPNILNILIEKFNIMPITTPDLDLKNILDGAP